MANGRNLKHFSKGLLNIIKDEERAFLSDETRENLRQYDYICRHDILTADDKRSEFSGRAVFFLMCGMNDDFLKPFFIGWLSASLPGDFSRGSLPSALWRACLRVLLVHWAAPDRCPYVGFDTLVNYSGLSKSTAWDCRDYLIKAKILKRSGWPGHYYLPTQHRRTLLKMFIEIERRFHSLTAEQLILKRDKAGPDWDSM